MVGSLKALLFDSWFDEYRGVICLIALHDGQLHKGDQVSLAQANVTYEVLELGLMYPEPTACDALYAGQVGYVITGMKTVREARVGDTIYHTKKPVTPFPGFKPAKPMVFAGIYPVVTDNFPELNDAVEKLILNDASVSVEKEFHSRSVLAFVVDFLAYCTWMFLSSGLNKNIIRQLLQRHQACSIKSKCATRGKWFNIENPADFPEPNHIEEIFEPVIDATIITPSQYLGKSD